MNKSGAKKHLHFWWQYNFTTPYGTAASQFPWHRRIPLCAIKPSHRFSSCHWYSVLSQFNNGPSRWTTDHEVGFQTRARTLLLVSLECAWTSARCRCKGTRASVASSVSLSLIRLALSLSRRTASRFLNRPLVTKVSDNAHCYSYRGKEQTESSPPGWNGTFTALWVVERDNKTQEPVCSRDACMFVLKSTILSFVSRWWGRQIYCCSLTVAHGNPALL